MRLIDDFLNNITMYRLLLYYLIALVVLAIVYSFAGILSFNGFSLIISVLFLLSVSWITNTVFASVYEAHTNVESVYITALILALIISPAGNLHDLIFLGWAAVLANAGKYILAIGKKHMFNPVALAVALTAFILGDSATWWVGTAWMLPAVLIGGVLIVKKIRREDLFFSFLISALIVILTAGALNGTNNFSLVSKIFADSPLLFFAFVMLTEPLTTPPTKKLRIWYGALVGLLFAPQIHIGSLYTTPELTLVLGNIYSYIVSPKEKLLLRLKEKIPIAPGIYDFVFDNNTRFAFIPGQYMEWTLTHPRPDDRGNRRYFTLASSPTENNVRIGVRFSDLSSSYKHSLASLSIGGTIVAGQRAGDFVLPKDQNTKLAFVAGGIGITPFRSMVKYLLDSNEKRDIIILYSNRSESEIVYKDVFDAAAAILGIKTVYILTERDGRMNKDTIISNIPDWQDRSFYLSGPNSMVNGFKRILNEMNVPGNRVKTDFFPGFA